MEQMVIEGINPFMKSNRPRPGLFDETVLRKTAEELARRAIKECSGLREEEFEEIVQDILVEVDSYSSGYQICRNLESAGWYFDGDDLVDVFGEMGVIRHRFHREAVKQWVIDAQIEPSFEVGAKVVFFHKDKREDVRGEIAKVERETGEYVVFCQSLGHVRTGSGTHGLILPFEICKKYEKKEDPSRGLPLPLEGEGVK